MTNIELKYNPFTVRTEILVEGEEIAKSSNLYRLRNTPLEEWIEILLPEIVDYCNDDRIEIKFCGLQRHAEIVENIINSYLKKNRTTVVKFFSDIAKGYRGRLGELTLAKDKLCAEIGEVENELDGIEKFPKTYKPTIEILVVSSGNSESKIKYVNALMDEELIMEDVAVKCVTSNTASDEENFKIIQYQSALIKGSPIDFEITVLPDFTECSNEDWQYFRNNIKEKKDTIVVAILSKEEKYINDEMLDYISNVYLEKGKINKQRFIFISEDIHNDTDYLNGEFGIKNPNIMGLDEIKLCKETMLEYINAYCVPDYIVQNEEKLEFVCSEVRAKICDDAEKRKQSSELEEKERLLFEIIDYVKNYNREKQNLDIKLYCDNITDKVLKLFGKRIKDKVFGIVTKHGLKMGSYENSSDMSSQVLFKYLRTFNTVSQTISDAVLKEYNVYFENYIKNDLEEVLYWVMVDDVMAKVNQLENQSQLAIVENCVHILTRMGIKDIHLKYKNSIEFERELMGLKIRQAIEKISKKRMKIVDRYEWHQVTGRFPEKDSYYYFSWLKERCKKGLSDYKIFNDILEKGLNKISKNIEEIIGEFKDLDEYIDLSSLEKNDIILEQLEEQLHEGFKIMHENLSISDSDAIKIEALDELIENVRKVIDL